MRWTRLFIAVVLLCWYEHSASADVAPEGIQDSFHSGGKRIRVERFQPTAKGTYPAVILLHGIDGLHEGNLGIFRTGARQMVDRGFVVLLIHYHDRTGGIRPEDVPARLKELQAHLGEANDKRPKKDEAFDAWLGTVADAVSHARTLRCVDGKRVALVGFSLGGFLATTIAARPVNGIAAAVTWFGGMPRDSRAELRRMPPTYIVAGEKDQVVPARESQTLHDLLQQKKLASALRSYPEVGHGFLTPEGKFDLLSALDAQNRTITFLRQHLGAKDKQEQSRTSEPGS